MTSMPVLTPIQRQAARLAASQARRARAGLKEKVASGELNLAQALQLASTDKALGLCPVLSLLKALPGVGNKRALAAMERHRIAVNRRLRGLGHNQIAGLIKDFDDR
ncbi:MAG: integration host factor, actinobacterial type [Propionibacteriaceae bacterium]